MIYAIKLLTVILSTATVERIGNDPSRLAIQNGAVVPEISSSLFNDTVWVEHQVFQVDLSGEAIIIVTFSWPGNGACLTVFKVVDSGFQFLGEFTNLFGGNGSVLSVSHASVRNEELCFKVEWIGHLRGYLPNPGIPKSFIPPEDVTSSFMMATDGDTLWMVKDSSTIGN